jgi:hypothetical protein
MRAERPNPEVPNPPEEDLIGTLRSLMVQEWIQNLKKGASFDGDLLPKFRIEKDPYIFFKDLPLEAARLMAQASYTYFFAVVMATSQILHKYGEAKEEKDILGIQKAGFYLLTQVSSQIASEVIPFLATVEGMMEGEK